MIRDVIAAKNAGADGKLRRKLAHFGMDDRLIFI